MPSFSVVIPSYARPERLASCLDAVARLDYPTDRLEVIVVDDGSPEPLERLAGGPEGVRVRFVRQSNAGPASARNAGAALARGEVLAFTDDDCAPDRDWLRSLAAAFAASPGAMLGGRTVNALPANRCSAASQLLVDYLYEYYNADPGGARFFTSNNMAVPVGAFRELGGFASGFPLAAAEDRDLCERWRRDGRPMVLVPEARVLHAHPMGLGGFWRQHSNYGRGAYHLRRARARRGHARLGFEGASFYLRMVRYPVGRVTASRALQITGLLGLSQVANAAGFFREAAGHLSSGNRPVARPGTARREHGPSGQAD